MTNPVVFVLKGYPRLSETFIAEEIAALEEAGLPIRIVALRRPTDTLTHPVHRSIKAPVSYLPEYLHEAPWRVIRAAWRCRRLPGWRTTWQRFWADLRREPTRNRLRRLGQSFVLAAELPEDSGPLHSHFIHTPASVVRYAARLTGRSWSCSAHAKDIWTSADWDLRDKLAEARFTVTCTAVGRDRLQALSPAGKAVVLNYHGLKLDRFVPLLPPANGRDGTAEPVRILSVGRAVEKKGFDDLIRALALLPPDLRWTWTHIGGGALKATLESQAEAAGLAVRITWRGSQDQDAVLASYRAADLFVLPCRIASDGDRDGLPNVLVEAQSQGLCCLSTTVSGVTELIRDGETGVLVPPDTPEALAAALERLIRDPTLRRRFGHAGMLRVGQWFDARTSTAALMALFRPDAASADA